MNDESFPVADTKSRSAKDFAIAGMSRMWIATIACLLTAIVLTWYALGDSGTEIVLHFQQGHGLKPGDAVRHRGIDIGTVTSIHLNDDLTGIKVNAELNAGADGIAREGSRFWIVRPQLDVTGIRGLETAVGAKYIAVSPGPISSPIEKSDFVGLESPPVDQLNAQGLELVLRGDQRFGVNPGSPLTWRGIEVGQVLSSTLSPDAMHVDTRVRLNANHQRLVTRNSKFWVTSGVHVDFGVSGVEVTAESLATIARGGVAFITPAGASGGQPVQGGDVFTLHSEADESWTERAAAINLLELHPPEMVAMTATWQEKLLGFTRTKQRRSVGVVVGDANAKTVIVPSDFVNPPEAAIDDSFFVAADVNGQLQKMAPSTAISGSDQLLRLRLDAPGIRGVSGDRFRVADEPEDCFVVRRQSSDSGANLVIEAIGKHELAIDGDAWRWTKSGLSRDVWHGAPVIAADDEEILGILLITDHVSIVPVRPTELPPL